METGIRAIAIFLLLPEIVGFFLGGVAQQHMQGEWRWSTGRLKTNKPKVHNEDDRGLWRVFIMYIINKYFNSIKVQPSEDLPRKRHAISPPSPVFTPTFERIQHATSLEARLRIRWE